MADDETESGAQPTADEAAAQPRDMGEQIRKVIPEEDAAAAGLVIGGMLEDLSAEERADPSPYLEPLPETSSEVAERVRRHREEGYDDRVKVRDRKFGFLMALLIALGAAAVAAALIVIASRQPATTDANAPVAAEGVVAPAAPAEGDPAVPPAQNPAPAGLVSDACVLNASAVVVQAALTETITKEDSTQTGYRGTAEFTNASDAPIILNLRRSQSVGDVPVEGWYDYQIPLAPGEVHTARLTGQSWTNRDPTWTVYTEYAVYPATDECRFQAGGDDVLDVLARPVPNPLPVGPGS